MQKLIPALLAAVLLGGCVADQGRDNPYREDLRGIDIEREVELHGDSGQEIATLFNTGRIADARVDTSGRSVGLQLNMFYNIEIAEDPLRPTILTKVGYIRRLQEDRGNLFLYEFYDGGWTRIGYMNPEGAVYRYEGGKEEYLGRHDLDSAVRALYWAPSGYGYDAQLQDHALVNLKDSDVATAEPRYRGVYHRSHKSAPPVVSFTLKRAGEAGLLADKYEKERADETFEEKLRRLREDRSGGFGDDENYGGLQYKNGNPVDDKGNPLKPGSIK
ncbi:MAG: hypothetical protein H6839_11655 [Planctomycetes bacterium]|nr:hypothetical protein [Planctomycetota bacterium]